MWSHGPYEAICGHMAHIRPYGHIWACVPYVTIGVHQSRPWLYAFHQAPRLLLHFALAHTSDQRPCHYTQKGNNHSRIVIWYRTATLLLSNTLCTYYSTTITTPCILINLHLLGIDSSVVIWYRTVTLPSRYCYQIPQLYVLLNFYYHHYTLYTHQSTTTHLFTEPSHTHTC